MILNLILTITCSVWQVESFSLRLATPHFSSFCVISSCLSQENKRRYLHILKNNRQSENCYGNGYDDGCNDNDDDEEIEKPYGNRSLAWTQKYRKLLPYEYARATAMNLGLRSKDEWDEYLADGKVYHGPYLPSRPDEMYVEDWVSWDEFLGIMRAYDDTKRVVQNVLQLKNMAEYKKFVEADPKRAEGLRIPAVPMLVYKDSGWTTYEDFFGCAQEDGGDYRCFM